MDHVDSYLTQMAEVVAEMPRDRIRDVVNVLMDAWERRASVFVLGNGGSASTASHMNSDLNKLTAVKSQPRFKAIALTDNVPLMTAWGNDTSYENIFAEQLENFLGKGDVVIGISTSGNSPNVLKALRVARERGAVTVGFTGRTGGQLKDFVDHCICVPSDNIGQQEDAHLILNHVIATNLRRIIEGKTEDKVGGQNT